jgi:CRP-like cAMP-binding protein
VRTLAPTNGYLVMVEQTAGCNQAHTLEQRMCRWLGMIYDRVDGAPFAMRQEFLANMLGVQRPSVSVAAASLQRQGTIEYHRERCGLPISSNCAQVPVSATP